MRIDPKFLAAAGLLCLALLLLTVDGRTSKALNGFSFSTDSTVTRGLLARVPAAVYIVTEKALLPPLAES